MLGLGALYKLDIYGNIRIIEGLRITPIKNYSQNYHWLGFTGLLLRNT